MDKLLEISKGGGAIPVTGVTFISSNDIGIRGKAAASWSESSLDAIEPRSTSNNFGKRYDVHGASGAMSGMGTGTCDVFAILAISSGVSVLRGTADCNGEQHESNESHR